MRVGRPFYHESYTSTGGPIDGVARDEGGVPVDAQPVPFMTATRPEEPKDATGDAVPDEVTGERTQSRSIS